MSNPNESKTLFYRESGRGFPLLFLHGGWGYEIYPFDAQEKVLGDRFRILIPDRSGYGRSGRIRSLDPGFHEAAAVEMSDFLDTLGIKRCALWGHSDGAVTAVLMTLNEPQRFSALVLEAIHYDRCKPRSRSFFETMASDPLRFGPKVSAVLAREHGDDYWQELLKMEGRAWLHILDHCRDPELDLFRNRLGEVEVPALVIQGSEDPRTEPTELERLKEAAPKLRIHIVAGAGHSPHSEPDFSSEVTEQAAEFLLRSIRR